MRYILSVPSKTFLMGEYLALHAGPSLILNTNPRFQLEIKSFGDSHCEGIHPQSPAGQWMRQQSQIFSQNQLKFEDPHEGRGGLGASSAQFVMVYAWQKFVESPVLSWKKEINPLSLWQDYKTIVSAGSGHSPSGADVVAQMTGQISLFYQKPFQVHALSWPFPDLGLFILRSGEKTKTHTHLDELTSFNTSSLERCFHDGERALYNKQSLEFCEAITEYGLLLKNMGFLTSKSDELLATLNSFSEVKSVKGCGAMGADTVLCLYDLSQKENLKQKINELKIEIVSDETDLSDGLHFQSQFLNQGERQKPLSWNSFKETKE